MVLIRCSTDTMKTAEETKITTRYPADVYAAIKQSAQEDSGSFNGMVIWILQAYIKRRTGK
jgi:hypothetical protein